MHKITFMGSHRSPALHLFFSCEESLVWGWLKAGHLGTKQLTPNKPPTYKIFDPNGVTLVLLFRYCIAGNFWDRKPSWIGKKWPFRRENFCGMLQPIIGGYGMPKFHGETFTDGYMVASALLTFLHSSTFTQNIHTSLRRPRLFTPQVTITAGSLGLLSGSNRLSNVCADLELGQGFSENSFCKCFFQTCKLVESILHII